LHAPLAGATIVSRQAGVLPLETEGGYMDKVGQKLMQTSYQYLTRKVQG
jgi:hypothetical protein